MKGKVWPAEWREHRDPISGLTVRQWTDYKGHSHHLYFTNPGWYDGGRRLLFASDRNNLTQLFSLDRETGEILQLTERVPPAGKEVGFLSTSVNPQRPEAYFWYLGELVALNLHTLEERTLYRAPEGFRTSITNCTADGRFVCTCIYEDLSHRFPIDLARGYIGFREIWEARPLSRILKIPTEGSSETEVVWEERAWIGHVNTSPTRPHLLTFCHEGPWDRVDQRIWGLDLATGRVWKIRPQEPGERIGHEFWLADGEHIGYHGHTAQGPVFGTLRYDNTDHREAVLRMGSTHFHSNHGRLIVGDGSRQHPFLLLWRWEGEEIEGPKFLCRHRSSFHIQQTHVHPRFSPDDHSILFTSDASGYGNVYSVEVPNFESLPERVEGVGL